LINVSTSGSLSKGMACYVFKGAKMKNIRSVTFTILRQGVSSLDHNEQIIKQGGKSGNYSS